MLKRDLIPLGELKVSPMGIGTWAWGNKFLWGYKEEMDQELQVKPQSMLLITS